MIMGHQRLSGSHILWTKSKDKAKYVTLCHRDTIGKNHGRTLEQEGPELRAGWRGVRGLNGGIVRQKGRE